MTELSQEHKEGIKELFHGALDFMASRFGDKHLKDYIEYCKEVFTESGITIFEYNLWVEEWEAKQK